MICSIGERFELLLAHARASQLRSIGVGERRIDLYAKVEPARSRIVVERERRKHDRHSRRGRGCARKPHTSEVGAQDVERILIEGEARIGADLRRADARERTARLFRKVRERRALEQNLVVIVRSELGASVGGTCQRWAVKRGRNTSDKFALYVPLEEALVVVREQCVAVKRERERREGAAGNSGNQLHLVEQRVSRTGAGNGSAAELLQYAIGERGGARPAARHRNDQPELRAAACRRPGFTALAIRTFIFGEWRIDGA